MTGRTTSIVALLTLLLGGGVGGIKFVQPALDEQHKLERQKADLTRQDGDLGREVAELRAKLNAMAMSSISYFDLSAYAAGGNRDDKRRVMEAKTVETLASLTEIFNDNHIKIRLVTPTGETTGLNKPVPTLPPSTPAPGATPPAPTPPPAATPTPAPGATTPPPPISLTHKTFTFDLEGEYPDLVKALDEIQGLPRAISINAYRLKLIQDPTAKGGPATPPTMNPDGTIPSTSLLALSFDMSITFLMDAGGALMTPPPAPAGSPHAAGLVASLGAWLCPPAMAAEAQPRPAVRPPNAIRGVSWTGNALHFNTATGKTPSYKVVGSRPGYLVLQFERTFTGAPMVLDAHAPGVRQVIALPAPLDPLATHVAITAAPGARLRLGTSPSHQLVVYVDQGASAAKPDVRLQVTGKKPVAPALVTHPAPTRVAPPVGVPTSVAIAGQGLGAVPAAGLQPAPSRPAASKPVASRPAPTMPMANPAGAPKTLANQPVASRPLPNQPLAGAQAHAPAQPAHAPDPQVHAPAPPVHVPAAHPATDRPLLALLPPHHGAAPAATGPVTTVPAPAERPDPLKIVVKPQPAKAPAPWEQEADHVAPEAARAWERDQLAQTAAAGVGLHGALPARPHGREGVVTVTGVSSVPLQQTPMVQTVVTLPVDAPHGRPAQAAPRPPAAAAPAPAAHAAPQLVPAHPAPQQLAARPPAAKPGVAPQDVLTRLDGARIEGSDLVIETHGAAPSFKVLGGNKQLLLLTVDHMPMAGQGQLIRINRAGIKQVRAALYDNRLPVTHLAIDTDGSVRLQPVADPSGAIRLRITGPGGAPIAGSVGTSTTADVTTSAITMTNDGRLPASAATPRPVVVHPKPQARMVKPPAATPRRPAAHKPTQPKAPATKPVATQPKPSAPNATPTPMAVPHGQPRATAPRPAATPQAYENRQLRERSLNSYRFPIDRDRQTGRVNPFKPLAKPGLPPAVPGAPAGLPAVPPAPGGAPAAPGAAAASGYALKAVVIGGGAPTALISVGGKSLMVGLNQSLPGNVRVKSIQTDYVILSANGQDIRLNLKR